MPECGVLRVTTLQSAGPHGDIEEEKSPGEGPWLGDFQLECELRGWEGGGCTAVMAAKPGPLAVCFRILFHPSLVSASMLCGPFATIRFKVKVPVHTLSLSATTQIAAFLDKHVCVYC